MFNNLQLPEGFLGQSCKLINGKEQNAQNARISSGHMLLILAR
jgi:hypothetical protein